MRLLCLKSLVAIVGFTCFVPVASTKAQSESIPLELEMPTTRISTEAPIKYQNPGNGMPTKRRPGGTSNHCLRDARTKILTVLVPESNPVLTTSLSPKLFFYIPKTPKTSVQGFEFLLKEANEQLIYQGTFKVNNQPGVFSLSLPANSQKSLLKVGQQYHWTLLVICSRWERSQDLGVEGWFQRIATDKNLTIKLKKAPLREHAIYAASGIWYDSLAILAELRQKRPADPALRTDWQNLLESVGLAEISQEPLRGELEAE